MKTYVVELKYEAYTYLTVQADNLEDAEKRAWENFDSGKTGDGTWDIGCVQYVKEN